MIDSASLSALLSPEEVREAALQAGFTKRPGGKLDPHAFLMAMVFRLLSSTPPSLALLTTFMNCVMSRPSLHSRFGKAAEELFRRCLQIIILKRVGKKAAVGAEALSPFKRLLVIDSTAWELPERLSWAFAGCGGAASEAGVKLQFMFDYLSAEFIDLTETAGNRPDQKHGVVAARLTRRGDLHLADLGYWSFNALKEIHDRGAYFVSRLNVRQHVWICDADGRKLEEADPIDLLEKVNRSAVEMNVQIRSGKRVLPVRLVAWRVPREVAEERRRKKRAEAKKKGRTPTARSLALCDWSIFVTNADAGLIQADMIRTVYRIRWSVELVFKSWKSVLFVHRTNVRSNASRLRCEIYAKMIFAVIVHRLYAGIQGELWATEKRELSLDKLWKYVSSKATDLHLASLRGVQALSKLLMEMVPEIIRTCEKLHQKSRKTSLQMINDNAGDENPEHIDYKVLISKILKLA